nr:meprin-A peptide A2 [mice, kidney, Peptide Partial, 19 aa] [Mus sp.]
FTTSKIQTSSAISGSVITD